ncbi:hypothetical protein J0B03_02520 [Alkalibacter rhizosphaerae]|uniref:Uncharacterized protein n=1 Tax=Alkalibacter rhizosphaerae TaxID=2815577 RepID=A0A975AID5_9FIRM|nr:hypothetical protein [Alkalibacter rhizosphaerae]QSX08963.1 hypothetical protein J0B03_02520 [Alkalibacter rhizosphaerae]
MYEELLENTHGKELSHLSSVQLHGGPSPNGLEEGLYSYTLKKWNYLTGTSVSLEKGSVIHLYHMDEKQEIKDLARVLSHEYGHHFTIYYLAKNDKNFFLDWEESSFYQIREGDVYPKMSDDPQADHRWMIAEICAEDYVQLYGSPLAKKSVKVYDISERLEKGLLTNDLNYSSQYFNIVPQENMDIPLALEVEVNTGYWQELSGIDSNKSVYSKPKLILGERKEVSNGYIAQTLEWTSSINEQGEEAINYTLVAMNSNTHQFLPIKSISDSETKNAVIGTVLDRNGFSQRVYTDSFVQQLGKGGYDDLRIIAVGRNGEAISSDSYLMDFNSGTLISKSEPASIQEEYQKSDQQEEKAKENKLVEFLDRIMDQLFSLFEQLFDKQVS